MKIYLKEIRDQDQTYKASLKDSWVSDGLLSLSETGGRTNTPRSLDSKSTLSQTMKPDSGVCDFSVRRVDDLYVLSGTMDFRVPKLCSRCGIETEQEVHGKFSHLFTKDAEMAGIAYVGEDDKLHGKNRGKQAHHNFNPSFSGKEVQDDLEITYVTEDFIDLKEILVENLTLSLPIQPLCKASCKGVCLNCGTDFNKGKCACDKLQKSNPFSRLSAELSKSLNLSRQKE